MIHLSHGRYETLGSSHERPLKPFWEDLAHLETLNPAVPDHGQLLRPPPPRVLQSSD